MPDCGFKIYEMESEFMQQRSIPLCIILSIITCGIYGIYWFVMITNETNAVTGHQGDTSGGVAFLLTIVTCNIYGLYWAYKMGDKLDNARTQRGIAPGSFPILFLILNLFGLSIITYAIIQSELNKYSPAA